MKEYCVKLVRPGDEMDEFERRDRNVVRARVQLPSGSIVSGQGYRIHLSLSRDGMLALGTNLIRAAHSETDELNFWHLHPSDSQLTSQNFGVFLHPESCEVLIDELPFEDIHTIVAGAPNRI